MSVTKTLSVACQLFTSELLSGYLTLRPVILQWKVDCFSSVTPPFPVLFGKLKTLQDDFIKPH